MLAWRQSRTVLSAAGTGSRYTHHLLWLSLASGASRFATKAARQSLHSEMQASDSNGYDEQLVVKRSKVEQLFADFTQLPTLQVSNLSSSAAR